MYIFIISTNERKAEKKSRIIALRYPSYIKLYFSWEPNNRLKKYGDKERKYSIKFNLVKWIKITIINKIIKINICNFKVLISDWNDNETGISEQISSIYIKWVKLIKIYIIGIKYFFDKFRHINSCFSFYLRIQENSGIIFL